MRIARAIRKSRLTERFRKVESERTNCWRGGSVPGFLINAQYSSTPKLPPATLRVAMRAAITPLARIRGRGSDVADRTKAGAYQEKAMSDRQRYLPTTG